MRGVAFGPPTTQTRYDDYTGFTRIFDGQTVTNWNGERDVWTIVDGMLHADTTRTPGQHHIHYTGPGAVMRDFRLKVEVKLSATGANNGIQYRSRCCIRRTAARSPIRWASRCRPVSRRWPRQLPPGLRPRPRREAGDLVAAVAGVTLLGPHSHELSPARSS